MFWHLTFLAFFIFSIIRFAIYLGNHGGRKLAQDFPIPRRTNELVDLSGEIRAETQKAWCFYDGKTTVWLPKSQCEWDSESRVMTLPVWLATEKDLI